MQHAPPEFLKDFAEAAELATKSMNKFSAAWRRLRRKRRQRRKKLAAMKGPAQKARTPKRKRHYRKVGGPKRERTMAKRRLKRRLGVTRQWMGAIGSREYKSVNGKLERVS